MPDAAPTDTSLQTRTLALIQEALCEALKKAAVFEEMGATASDQRCTRIAIALARLHQDIQYLVPLPSVDLDTRIGRTLSGTAFLARQRADEWRRKGAGPDAQDQEEIWRQLVQISNALGVILTPLGTEKP